MTDWRYIAQHLTGDKEIFVSELPIAGAKIGRVLSGSGYLTGSIELEVASLKQNGRPILEKWSTAIWAERDGRIFGGGILVGMEINDGKISLDCMGVAGYPSGMPYVDSIFFVEVDPLDVVRHIWEHLQGKPRGNLGVKVDQTKSDVIVGTASEQGEYDEETGDVGILEDGPIRLSWYETTDLGDEIDKLAEETPFDYAEESEWVNGKLVHRYRIGYPTLGQRRHDLRFVFGENIAIMPPVESSDEGWGNEVLFLGAGEGREMSHALVSAQGSDQIRRVAVVIDKEVRRDRRALKAAKAALAGMIDDPVVTEITVRDHPHAPFGSWNLGDEIYIQIEGGWADIAGWYRIMEETISPEAGDIATLSVVLTDKPVT